MSRGRFDRLGASSTLCHAHHSCVHIVTDTPPPVTGTCHTALVLCVCLGVHRLAVWLFECQIWFIVLPPPHPCVLHASSSTCGGTHNTQGQIRCPILPNALCFVAFTVSVHVHGQDWTFKCPLSSPRTSRLHVDP